jgi:hypothetical protein
LVPGTLFPFFFSSFFVEGLWPSFATMVRSLPRPTAVTVICGFKNGTEEEKCNSGAGRNKSGNFGQWRSQGLFSLLSNTPGVGEQEERIRAARQEG